MLYLLQWQGCAKSSAQVIINRMAVICDVNVIIKIYVIEFGFTAYHSRLDQHLTAQIFAISRWNLKLCKVFLNNIHASKYRTCLCRWELVLRESFTHNCCQKSISTIYEVLSLCILYSSYNHIANNKFYLPQFFISNNKFYLLQFFISSDKHARFLTAN